MYSNYSRQSRFKKRRDPRVLGPGAGFPPDKQNVHSSRGKPIHVAYTNACSIGNKWSELNVSTSGCDLIAVTETWLNITKSIPSLYPPDYCIYRADREENMIGGGAMLMVSEHYQQQSGPILILPYVQSVSCKVKLGRSFWTFVCCYRSPQAPAAESTHLITFLEELVQGNDRILFLGDFNAPGIDWLCKDAAEDFFRD